MKRPCSNQPCANLVEGGGHCASCAPKVSERRGKTAARGYDAAHRRLRAAVLARDGYVCQLKLVCEGAFATEMDHIVPIEEAPARRLDDSNCQAACKACNSAKRNRLGFEGEATRGRGSEKQPPVPA